MISQETLSPEFIYKAKEFPRSLAHRVDRLRVHAQQWPNSGPKQPDLQQLQERGHHALRRYEWLRRFQTSSCAPVPISAQVHEKETKNKSLKKKKKNSKCPENGVYFGLFSE